MSRRRRRRWPAPERRNSPREGSLLTAEAAYIRAIGSAPPADLAEPQPLKLPVRNEQQAAAMAGDNNPSVIAALFNLAGSRNAVDVAFGALLPQLSLQSQAFSPTTPRRATSTSNGYQVLANLSVPLYQGGSEYAAVRQARETVTQDDRLVADARRTAVQNAVQAWQTLQAALASADSSRAAVQANQVALEGEERQALVGTATTLDVLVQQQTLLNARLTLVQNLASIVTASYGVASAIGRLTARDLALPVTYYDDTAYYQAVKNKWFGLSGPGRIAALRSRRRPKEPAMNEPKPAAEAAGAEPSMEDILASIRRILNEEERRTVTCRRHPEGAADG